MYYKDEKFCDLRIHSNYSPDGVYPVKDIMDNLLKNKIFYASITDNNNIQSIKQIKSLISNQPEKYKNIKMINGVEITCSDNKNVRGPLKVLLYDFDENNHELKGLLNKISLIEKEKTYLNIKELEKILDIKFTDKEINESRILYGDLNLETITKMFIEYKKKNMDLPKIKNSGEFLEIIKPLIIQYKNAVRDGRLSLQDNRNTPSLSGLDFDIEYPNIDELFDVAKKSKATVGIADPFYIKTRSDSEALNKFKLERKISDTVEKKAYNRLYLDNQQKYVEYLQKKAKEYKLKLGINIVIPVHSSVSVKSPSSFYFDISKHYKLIQSWGSDFYGAHKSSIKKIGITNSLDSVKRLNIIDYIENGKKYSVLKFGGTLDNHFEKLPNYHNIPYNKTLLERFERAKKFDMSKLKIDKGTKLVDDLKLKSLSIAKRRTIADNLYKHKNLYNKYLNQIVPLMNKGILTKKNLTTTYLCRDRMNRASSELRENIKQLKDDTLKNYHEFYKMVKSSTDNFIKNANKLSKISLDLYVSNKEKLAQLELIEKGMKERVIKINYNYKIQCLKYLLEKDKLSKKERSDLIRSIVNKRDSNLELINKRYIAKKNEILNIPLGRKTVDNSVNNTPKI